MDDELTALRIELARMRQRSEESLKSGIMSDLDRWAPDERAVVFERVSAQIRERLSRRDTARVQVIPREDP